MKRYFIGDEEITEEEAKETSKRNREYMNSGDFNEMMKIVFIIVIEK